ncbi:glycosyltransferase [Blastococcus jejuensis]|uniref:4,4'-diaponeurosporenoate glycosyltransferase n=1 Tax=Blastococcus jejuensis TaxID=351224 RepID=A0ABP6P948_9ACTN
MSTPRISVIVRAKDKVDTIGETLAALRRQSVAAEVIVVDSGSTDGTLAVAGQWADRVIEIPAHSFSYGGALNVGAEAAGAPVHAALSAHCVPESVTWLEDSLRRYERTDVAATNAALVSPLGVPIADTYLQTLEDVVVDPTWGFSNHASTWRADVWADLPFREDLGACEDKEWSWRVLAAGWTIAYGPELGAPMAHRRSAGLRPLYERITREAQAMVSLGAAEPLGGRGALRAWWSSFPSPSRKPTFVRRASPYRMVELVGAWRGSRLATELPGPRLPDLLAASGRPHPVEPYLPWI